MKKVLFLFVIVLGTLLFAQIDTGVEFNQTGRVETQLGLSTSNTGWAVYALLSLFFVLMLAAVVYMVGKAFGIPQAEAWAKVELLNIFGSFLLLVMILVILNAMYSIVAGSLLRGSAYCLEHEYDGSNPLDFAMCKVQAQITTLENLWAQANEANKPQEVKASTCYSFWGLTLYCGDWYGDLRQRIESAHYVGTKALSLAIPLHAEFVLLRYIAQNMMAVFLPLGIVLRCFPPTRGPAGLLIATSIGLYFVFPVLNFVLDPSTKTPETEPITQQKTDYACFQGFKNGISMIKHETDVTRSQKITYSFESASDIIAEITITGLFYPMVAFAGAVMFIYITAPFFGGEVMDFFRVVSKLV